MFFVGPRPLWDNGREMGAIIKVWVSVSVAAVRVVAVVSMQGEAMGDWG